ncbi:HIT family protein [Candidatus Dependentiae bacterium]|nr:HIT family protein [Candidatus Dependentiae bacterium]MBU4387002.1 HIT family protein [Candidatus Dependentiae bacterium]MCG2756670.1 HIT family protein [Candidatus Dependentiae bacterium]
MNKIVKRILISIITISIIFSGIYLFLSLNNFNPNKPCAFCNPKVIKTHTFYEDEYVIGMCSHRQVKPWHCLVVTKRHIKRFEDISDKELLASNKLLKKINIAVQKIMGPASYIILEKNGTGLQSVPHIHFHYIPEKDTNSQFISLGYLWDFFTYIFKKPMSTEKLSEYVDQMKAII